MFNEFCKIIDPFSLIVSQFECVVDHYITGGVIYYTPSEVGHYKPGGAGIYLVVVIMLG